jgi:hypothetical protein
VPGDYLARRDQQEPPVAGGVGALGARRSPGHGWFMVLTRRPEYNRGKVRLRSSVALSPRKDQPMSTIATPDRFATPPDEQTLTSTVTALEEHGFSVEVVDGPANVIFVVGAQKPGCIHIVPIRQVARF